MEIDKILSGPEPSIAEKIMTPIEGTFQSLGLNTPLLRFGGGFAATGLALHIAQPDLMFTKDGEAREWVLSSQREDATPLPWWMAAMAPGLLFGFFI